VAVLTRRAILEPVAIFGLIMAYIWRFRADYPWSWLLVLGIVVVSHLVRGDRLVEMGYQVQGFTVCLRRFGPALLAIVAMGFAGAWTWGSIRPIGLRGAALALALYLPWGLFQQYLLNGYLLNRLDGALSPAKSGTMAAALFSLVHLPNWFLMVATLAFGYCASLVYRRHKNLYFLGLAHGVIGFTIFVTAPDWMIHHLRIGPGWFGH
jgi:membrane protease YdiL (CAAX protease family)